MPTEISCTPNNLMDLASCMKCIPVGMQREVMIALLARIAGIDPDPNDLMDAAKCLKCIPTGMQDEVITYLLCQLSNGVTPCESLSGSGSPLGVVGPNFVGQLYHDTTDDTYYRSTGLTSADWVAISGGAQLLQTIPPGNEQLLGVTTSDTGVDLPGVTGIIWNGEHNIGGFFCSGDTSLVTISCPNLIDIDVNNISPGPIDCQGCSSLTDASFPMLQSLSYYLYFTDCSSLTSVDFGSLVSAGDEVDFQNCVLLASLDLHSLVTVSLNVRFNGCTTLSNVDLSSWVPTDGKTISFAGCALDVQTVELILRRCVLAGVTTCTINLSGGTNSGTASLNAQGQADVVTLGAQLTINP